MEELGLAFAHLFQQNMQIPPSWHHCIISPHQCLVTQPLSVALSQHHRAISSWLCTMGRKYVHSGWKLWPTSQEVPKGIKNLVVISWTLLPGNNTGSEICSVTWHSTVLWRNPHSRWKSKIVGWNEGPRNAWTSSWSSKRSRKVRFPCSQQVVLILPAALF